MQRIEKVNVLSFEDLRKKTLNALRCIILLAARDVASDACFQK